VFDLAGSCLHAQQTEPHSRLSWVLANDNLCPSRLTPTANNRTGILDSNCALKSLGFEAATIMVARISLKCSYPFLFSNGPCSKLLEDYELAFNDFSLQNKVPQYDAPNPKSSGTNICARGIHNPVLYPKSSLICFLMKFYVLVVSRYMSFGDYTTGHILSG
jgi:hypothetical protein